MTDSIRVQIETGKSKSWASALDWPGWTRSGKDAERALAALAEAAPRYAAVATAAGHPLPATAAESLKVTETTPGSASSDWAPMLSAKEEGEPTSAAEAPRRAALVAAAWAELDRIVDAAPAELRKGPRGGGRDRDEVVQHVLGAEAEYVRKLELNLKVPAAGDPDAIQQFRESILEVLRAPSDGTPANEKGWPVRYAARRIAWHVLDHAWEIENRSE